jgi:hypothetical protein
MEAESTGTKVAEYPTLKDKEGEGLTVALALMLSKTDSDTTVVGTKELEMD